MEAAPAQDMDAGRMPGAGATIPNFISAPLVIRDDYSMSDNRSGRGSGGKGQ